MSIRTVGTFFSKGLLRPLLLCALLPASLGAAQFTLTWDDNSDDEDGFKVERADGAGAFAPLATVAANVETYVDNTAVDGTKYTYRVYAYNTIGNSTFTNVVTNAPTFTTQPVAAQSVPAFGTATFTAAAAGIPTPTFQWRKNGVNLTNGGIVSGATLGTLTLTGVSLTDADTYTVAISNSIESNVVSSASVLTVIQATQTITFPTITTKTFGDAGFNPGATSDSGLTVSYASSNTAVATVSGSTITIVGAGTATITATQAGDSNYLPATSVQRTLTVNKASQTITFGSISPVTFGASSFSLGATSSSGLPVSYASSSTAVATVSGSTLTPVGGGSTNITASQAGNANYNAATSVVQAFTVNKADQVITFGPLATMVVGDAPVTLTATSTSGLTVTYGSSGLSVATISGNTLTAVGAGTVNISANQSGNANYNAAPQVLQSLQVNKAPTYSIQPPATRTINAGNTTNFTVGATGTPSPTFQWQISTNGGGTWTNLTNTSPYSGVTTTTMTITSAPASLNGNLYRALATNSVAATPSTAVALTVNFAPSFTTQPANSFAPTGGSTSFTAVAAGNPAPTLQWQISTNGGSTFSNLANDAVYSGVTTGTLTITGATAGLNNARYRVVATNSVTSTNSSQAILTVGNVAPAITTDPTDVTILAGGNATFTAAASGGPAPTLQWQISTNGGGTFSNLANDSVYSGVTTGTLTITAAPHTLNAARYRAVATNAAGTATSAAAILTVNAVAPVFTTHPANEIGPIGGNVSYTVAASGNPAPSFQWQISTNSGSTWTNLTNSAPYSGVTTDTLTITGITLSLNGNQYRAVATNPAGSVNSNGGTFTIGDVPPSITTNPAGQVVPFGGNASFTVVAGGNPTPTFQWQISTDGGFSFGNLSNGGAYSGVTTATLSVNGVSLSHHGNQFRAIATNVAGSATSAGASLSVTVTAPAITSHPTDQTPVGGATATFTVAASGSPAPTIQWLKDGVALSNGGVVSGATSTTLTLTGVSAADAGSYTAAATNAAGTVTSNAANLILLSAPSFTQHPASQSVASGATVALTAAVTGTPTPLLQWRKNGTPISGATNPTLTLTAVATADSGSYTVVATNSVGSATSNAATLTVAPPVDVAPAITTQPVGQNANYGATVTMSVVATGSPTPTYQWQKNGVAIGGATSSTLTLSNATPADDGTYTVVVTNVAGSVTSTGAGLTVASATSPAITVQPVGQSASSGSTVILSVTATGSSPLSYQWRRDGVNVGGDSSTLTLNNVGVADSGTYTVVITNAGGTITSAGATLTVAPLDYSGEYFGTFADNQGTWALYVRPDGTGLLIAFLSATKTSIVTNVTVSATGTFDASVVLGNAGAVARGEDGTPPVGAATTSTTVSGSIVNGTVTGQLGTGLSLSGAEDTSAGSGAAYTGLYTVSAIGTTQATTYAIVGPSGQTLAVIVGATSSDAVSGTLNSSGQLAASTATGAQFTMGISSTSLTTTVAAAGADPVISLGLPDDVPSVTRLSNMSARAVAGSGENTLIVGFVVQGATKPVLIRAVGPGLQALGVTNPAADPALALHNGSAITETNQDWGGTTALKNTFTQLGAFGLSDSGKDAALTATLPAQAYTALVSGSGVALAEVYDADTASTGRLVNLSARARVGTGEGVLIVGFVVPGNAPKSVLLRAIGPALASQGVGSPLADPEIALYQGSSVLFRNDNWGGSATLSSAFSTVGAFPLSSAASKDAAMLVTLAPGIYTAIVSGVSGGTGVALAEIYEMP